MGWIPRGFGWMAPERRQVAVGLTAPSQPCPATRSTRSARRSAASGVAVRRAAAAIAESRAGSPSRAASNSVRSRLGEFVLAHDLGRAGVGEQLGVLALVVVEGDLQRDQDRGAAGDGDLAHGGGAGAADHQVGRAQAAGHVAEEGRDLGLDQGVGVEARGRGRGTRAGSAAAPPAACAGPPAGRRRRRGPARRAGARPGCRR